MPTSLFVCETLHTRNSGGPARQPTPTIATSSNADLLATNSVIMLSRGIIPRGAERNSQPIASLTGVISTGGASYKQLVAQDGAFIAQFGTAWVDNSTRLIKTAGVDGYYEAGRNAGGQYLNFAGALLTAVQAYATTPALANIDALTRPTAWSSPVGACLLSEIEDATLAANVLRRQIASGGNVYQLPNGTRLLGCAYAAVGPDATILIEPSDWGSTVPTSVSANTADTYNNNPTAFYTRKGAATLAGVALRCDGGSLTATASRQPLGITAASGSNSSKWVFVIDGNVVVTNLKHGSMVRPRDIWARVIAPALSVGKLDIYDDAGNLIGALERLQYLDYARCIVPRGNKKQSDVDPVA